jgi:hypothetical protein
VAPLFASFEVVVHSVGSESAFRFGALGGLLVVGDFLALLVLLALLALLGDAGMIAVVIVVLRWRDWCC